MTCTQVGAGHYGNPAQDKELKAECEAMTSPNTLFTAADIFYVANLL